VGFPGIPEQVFPVALVSAHLPLMGL